MSKIEDSICQAIELIVNKSIRQAGYDKTIQAVIKSCVDPTIGKYKVSYQDSIFYAYSTNIDVTYHNGAVVYVLVPGNDMSKDKTILGTVDKLGVDYVVQPQGDQGYDIVGKNVVSSVDSSDVFLLSSYRKGQYVSVLYAAGGQNNTLIVDQVALNEYIKESSYLLCGAAFKTSLDASQRYKGNYGIVFGLDFTNDTGEVSTQYYTVDINNMTGDPYGLESGKRQYGIFAIDGQKFVRLSSISIFTSDFPHSKTQEQIEEQGLYDIQVYDIELAAAAALTAEQLSGCAVSFITPDGTFFSTTATNESTLRIIAQVRIKGKKVDAALQSIPFYWFRQDLSIDTNNERYCKYGGRGWKCLNKFNVIDDQTNQKEWLPASDTYTLPIGEVTAKQIKLKCAIVYNGNVYSNTIVIKNLNSDIDITIASDRGTAFYYDIGRPTLTCLINEEQNNDYTYVWAKEDALGNLTILPEDTETYTKYQDAVAALNALNEAIADGNRFPNEAATELSELQAEVDKYNYIQIVHQNKILKVSINQITNFAIYKCSVYKNDVYCGTAEIRLTNSLQAKDRYTLIINNGIQMFQYDEYGVSPASPAADNPITIPALTFSVFDNTGEQLSQKELSGARSVWKVPRQNTMITPTALGVPAQDQKYYEYFNVSELSYNIANKYSYINKNNTIELTLYYKDMTLKATTNLTFVKQGEDGTNGTKIVAKIVPNAEYISGYPTLTVLNNEAGTEKWNFDVGIGQPPFLVKLYEQGEQVFSGSESANNVELEWSILANIYSKSKNLIDKSDLTIEKNNGIIKYRENDTRETDSSANIVQCKITYKKSSEDTLYVLYATMPIILAIVTSDDYKINLKENTGFRYVEYTSAGTLPKYDSTNPFEVIITKKINGVDQVVSMSNNAEHGITEFEWSVLGSVYDTNIQDFPQTNDLTYTESTINTCVVKPAPKYDGLCVNNLVFCHCDVADIFIPVHLYLNKYGFAELNDWNGNSIQINDDGGYILAPQIGAGVKDQENRFTGVIMGKAQQSNRTTPDIGLLGFNQGQRSFFINSENGGAIFGVRDKGQIIIDPEYGNSMLYSANAWTDDSYAENGFLTSNTPKYNYNSNGLVINLDQGIIYCGKTSFKDTHDGFYLGPDGFFIGGNESNSFKVTPDGTVTLEAFTGQFDILNKLVDLIQFKPDETSKEKKLYIQGMWVHELDAGNIATGTLNVGTGGAHIQGVLDLENNLNIEGDLNVGGNLKLKGTIECGQDQGLSITGLNADWINAGKLKAEFIDSVNLTAQQIKLLGQLGGWTINSDSISSANNLSSFHLLSSRSASEYWVQAKYNDRTIFSIEKATGNIVIGSGSIESNDAIYSVIQEYRVGLSCGLQTGTVNLITQERTTWPDLQLNSEEDRMYIGTDGAAFTNNSKDVNGSRTVIPYTTVIKPGFITTYVQFTNDSTFSGIDLDAHGIYFNQGRRDNGITREVINIASMQTRDGGIDLFGKWMIFGQILDSKSNVLHTSDRRVKNSIQTLDSRYTKLFDKLQPRRFKFNQGTSDRYHTGFIAQQLEDARLAAGVTDKQFAAVCHTEQDEYCYRPQELIPLCVNEIQKLKAQVSALEKEIKGDK